MFKLIPTIPNVKQNLEVALTTLNRIKEEIRTVIFFSAQLLTNSS